MSHVPSSDDDVQSLRRDVDELLSYIAIVRTPEMDAVREPLERSLSGALRALNEGGRAQATWTLLADAAVFAGLFGVLAGFLLSRGSRTRAARTRHGLG